MRMSISTRIFLCFTVVFLAFGSASAYTVWRMTALRESVTVIWEEVIPVANDLKELSRRLRVPEEFLVLRRPSDVQWVARLLPRLDAFGHIREVEDRLATLASKESLSDADGHALGEVAERLAAFRTGKQLKRSIQAELAPDRRASAEAETSEEAFDALIGRTVELASSGALARASPETRATTRALRRLNRTVMSAARAVNEPLASMQLRADEDEKTAILAVLFIAGGALVLSLLMLLMIQLTLRPVRRLQEGARRIAAGDYGERVRVRSRHELGQLADEFNTMAAALETRDLALARQRAELLRADRLATIGKLAAQITHEVRNPLTSISLNTELLEEVLDSPTPAPEARALLVAIQQEVERLRQTTEEYLRYAGMPQPERTHVVPSDLLDAFLAFVGGELDAAEITVETRGLDGPSRGGPGPIWADADQLRQAFLNVVRNAMEALSECPLPRHLSISLASGKSGGVVISFGDNGPGIDPALGDQIFEPFVTGKRGGTGLGLALTRQILHAHGGSVDVVSPVHGGQGTCIRLHIPAPDRA